MEQTLVELNQKIESLSTQIGYLIEQAQINERRRQDRAELVRDLTQIADEAFQISVEQLEEIQEYIELSDLAPEELGEALTAIPGLVEKLATPTG